MVSPWMGDHSSDKVDAVVKNRVKSQEWRNGGPPMKNSRGHFLYLLPNALFGQLFLFCLIFEMIETMCYCFTAVVSEHVLFNITNVASVTYTVIESY